MLINAKTVPRGTSQNPDNKSFHHTNALKLCLIIFFYVILKYFMLSKRLLSLQICFYHHSMRIETFLIVTNLLSIYQCISKRKVIPYSFYE